MVRVVWFLIVATLAGGAAGSTEPAAYVEAIPGSDVSFEMVRIPAGSLTMGSPKGELGRSEDEGPQHQVEIGELWMGRYEVRWDEYRLFMSSLDLAKSAEELPEGVDAITRPTPPYVPMDFGMGVEGYPAIAMTQFAARQYTRWLSQMTGRFYRLPTEAEWEYACRAGATGATYFAASEQKLEDHSWYSGNGNRTYHPAGELGTNGWGLHDILGNVAEWTLDAYRPYADGTRRDPVSWPKEEWNRVVRGGSFQDPATDQRCAARRPSKPSWKRRDPQFPKSIWFLTDAPFVGFRVVRPVGAPPPEEQEKYWAPDVENTRRALESQRTR